MLLVVTGSVGVGKTTIGSELTNVLEAMGIAHSFVDLDGLTMTFPRPPDDRFGDGLALANLQAVWSNCRGRGSKNLIVARVLETPDYLDRLQQATDLSEIVVCELTASKTTLIDRVRSREVGSGRLWHERRTLELADSLAELELATFSVTTDNRQPPDIAAEIAERVNWTT